MEIILAKRAGFCFGVNRAMDLALKIANDGEGLVHTLGPLIHNPQAVEKLKSVGIEVENDVSKIEEGTVIIRSHGVSPEVIESAESKGLDVVNATCPFVKRAQDKSRELLDDGYTVVISGDKNHPEVLAILGYANNKAIVVEDESDFIMLEGLKRVGVIVQTTQSLDKLKKLSNFLLERVGELKIYNTICTTTVQRQDEAAKLSKEVDLMIVIGGYNSANTNRLAEICSQNSVKTYHIESADELKGDWFANNINKVGITAGASTPNWIIKEVLSRMSENNVEVQEKNEEVQENNEVVQDTNEVVKLTKKEIISGKVVEVSKEGAFVDIGAKTEGFIPAHEVSDAGKEVNEVLTEGEQVELLVLEVEDEDGKAILSKKRVDREKAWDRVGELFETGETIEAEVTREVKGGLVADIGLRGFIPASHVAVDYIEDLSQFIGKKMELKVIEVERENNNVVLSHKVILEEELTEKKKEVLNSLEEGQVIEGKVTKLVDFGAFVDLGGVEGLLHISEISWGRIGHPSEVLEEGEEIKVKILGVNPDKERISLGLKQIQADPWDEFVEEVKVDDKVKGKITKIVDFGAFMEVKPGVEGLIHISQLSREHVDKVEDVLTVDEEVEAKVINIENDDRRVGLSIKELQSAPKVQKRSVKRSSSPKVQSSNDDEGSGVKLGDVFGDLFNN